MARVIEKKIPEAEKQIIHKACGAKIGYYPIEIQQRIKRDYGGGSTEIHYIICPNCSGEIVITMY